jgi:uncharacterized membrane protein (DUF373 family)
LSEQLAEQEIRHGQGNRDRSRYYELLRCRDGRQQGQGDRECRRRTHDAVDGGISIVSSGFDPTDYEVFQAFFGMIFTVIIALEFKRSLLVVAERRHGVVQVRTVILIALLAIVRKLMIIDLSSTDARQLLALAAAIVALGSVHWLVRDQDRRDDAKTIQATEP